MIGLIFFLVNYLYIYTENTSGTRGILKIMPYFETCSTSARSKNKAFLIL